MTLPTDRTCPHCKKILEPWLGPPETGWGMLLVCCNDVCPHFKNSNADVAAFNPDSKIGFRYAEDPENGFSSFNLASYCGDTYMEHACKMSKK